MDKGDRGMPKLWRSILAASCMLLRRLCVPFLIISFKVASFLNDISCKCVFE